MRQPKILFIDIETEPNLAYVWGKWEQNVIAYKKEFEILSIAYKWLNEKKTYCITKEGQKDDKKICEDIKLVLNSCDIAVAHNGNAFDFKKINARLAFHGSRPCSILATVDTKKMAKKHFSFNSNSLDDLGQHLKLGRKVKHEGFDLWLKCMNGESSAWKRMKKYNIMDVILLEKVYKRLLPFMNPHPNVAKLQNKIFGCDKCGSDEATRHGYRSSPSGIRQKWLCRGCGGYFTTALTVANGS